MTQRLADLCESLAGVGDEPGLALLEPELDLAGRAVAVLGQLEVDDLAVGVLILRPGTLLVTPQEEDEVGVLLDRPGLAEVGQARLLRLAHLGLA